MVNEDIILNKHKDTERYILQAEGKTVKKWHKKLNYTKITA